MEFIVNPMDFGLLPTSLTCTTTKYSCDDFSCTASGYDTCQKFGCKKFEFLDVEHER